MSYNAVPYIRNNPAVFTSLVALALAVAVQLAGATSGAAQERMRNPAFGRNAAILAEQRRHAAALERIEAAIGRLQADVALLTARIEATAPNREAVDAAPVNRASGKSPLTGPEFDLGALRASFDAETADAEAATPGSRKEIRRHPRKAAKGAPAVRI
jgi:hypothetical protein